MNDKLWRCYDLIEVIKMMKWIKTLAIPLLASMFLIFSGCTPQEKSDNNGDRYKTVIDFQYESISIGYNAQALVVKQNGLYGAYIKQGDSYELKVPVRYLRIQFDSGNGYLFAYTENNKIEIYTPEGNRLTDQTYQQVLSDEKDNSLTVTIDGKNWGVLSLDGNWILEPKYQTQIIPLHDGTYIVETKDGSDWVNETGESLLPTDKNIRGVTKDSVASYIKVDVKQNGNSYRAIIGKDGNYIVPPIYTDVLIATDEVGNYYFVGTSKDGMKTLYDKEGKILFDQNCFFIKPVGDSLFRISQNDKVGLVSQSGETILPIEYDDIAIQKEFAIVLDKSDHTYRLYNLKQNQFSDERYDQITCFQNAPDIAVVTTDKKVGFVTADHSVTISPSYDNYYNYYSNDYGMFLVQKDGKWGFIDWNNSTKFPFEYSHATYFNEKGYAYLAKDGKAGIITADGNEVVPFVFDAPKEDQPLSILMYGDANISVVWKDGKCGCIEIVE